MVLELVLKSNTHSKKTYAKNNIAKQNRSLKTMVQILLQ